MEASKLETNEGRPLQVYEPNRQIHLGWRVWPEMFGELYRARELLWRLAWRDVRARTKQSAFGIAVSVVSPLMLMGVFAYLNRQGAVEVGGTSVSYPLFLYAGLLPWQMLAGGLTRPALTVPGHPDTTEIAAHYARRSGRDTGGLRWYLAFAAFKLAVILEGVHYRYVQGQTVGPGFEGIGAQVAPLVRQAHETLDEA